VDVDSRRYHPRGALIASDDKAATENPGLTIHFKIRASAAHAAYFRLNLQNRRLDRKPGTTKYLRTLPPARTW